MIIRKLYRFEACHVVRGCNSQRCKQNFHGHSYVVEIFFESSMLTDYGMVIDFGDLKKIGVAEFIDKLDHSWHFSTNEADEIKDFIRNNNERWIELPFNPTAENYAAWIHKVVSGLITKAIADNQLDNHFADVKSVRVHETATGYAESSTLDSFNITDVAIFSEGTNNS